MKGVYVIIVTFLQLSVCNVVAAPVTISRSVSSNNLYLGDVLLYTMTIKYAQGVQFTPPKIGTGLESLDIHHYDVIEDQLPSNDHVYTVKYNLSKYSFGNIVIPALTLRYKYQQQLGAATAPLIRINMRELSKQDGDEKIVDIFPVMSPEISWIVPGIVAGSISIILVIVLQWRIWKKIHLKQSQFVTRHSKHSPEDMAIKHIQRLQKKGYLENKKVKQYYVEITAIFKRYLSTKYHYPFKDMTSTAVQEYLNNHRYNQEIIKRVASLLRTYDTIKFTQRMVENGHRQLYSQLINTISYIRKHSYDR